MSFELVQLGDISQNISRRFDFKGREEVVFINTGDILSGEFLTDELVSVVGLPGQAKKAIKKGDILYSEIRPGNKRYLIVNDELDNYVVSTKFMVIQADHKKILPEYLYLILTSKHCEEEFKMIAESRSGTFPQVTFDSIAHYQVELPDLDVQKQIVDIAWSLSGKERLNTQTNQTLEQMAQALFKSWFVDFDPVIDNALDSGFFDQLAAGDGIPEPLAARVTVRRAVREGMRQALRQTMAEGTRAATGAAAAAGEPTAINASFSASLSLPAEIRALFPSSFVEHPELGWIPEGWESKALVAFGAIVCGKTPSKSNSEYFGRDVPFVKIPDMHGNVFITDTVDSLSLAGAASQSKKEVPAGSICVSCIATVGKVVITTRPCHTNQQINSIIPDKNFDTEYLYFQMLNLYDWLHVLASGGSATLNLNTGNFSKIDILAAPDEIRRSFHKMVMPIFKKILQGQEQNRILANLRDTLLPKLLSGELTLSESEFLSEAQDELSNA
ncbi:restriction endonuclease subunit S [Shewanella algae]|uniref:restriction endonuclease subunit S n=1 Tax=Shewanella algae TaxID=38313 RepID=UPI000E33130C|nr:restriction endonuclease subunit S [Shewanella algae]AXQ15855.1 hypothetical protein BS332_17930 [Shewanella algae]QXP18783.1 restriction endonuclease subunit S [Shewanella algae]QXP28344.1 restriction endonuclease subunit S [Shewanella algae]QXP34646.1 restriction endonuclease subunit S [Shewanella algae]QXP37538.1 restriction endonuclease subunit S [Shewanella algae]